MSQRKQTRARLYEPIPTGAIVFREVPPCAQPGVDPEIFHPDPTDEFTIAKAKSICEPCTQKDKCLEIAFSGHHNKHGIYGGMTPDERARYRVKIRNAAYKARIKAEKLAS